MAAPGRCSTAPVGVGEDVMNGSYDNGHFAEGDVPSWSCGPRHPYPTPRVSPESWPEEHQPVTLDTLEDGEAGAVGRKQNHSTALSSLLGVGHWALGRAWRMNRKMGGTRPLAGSRVSRTSPVVSSLVLLSCAPLRPHRGVMGAGPRGT